MALLGLAFLVSPITSLGIHFSAFPAELEASSNPPNPTVASSTMPMPARSPAANILSRRRVLESILVAAISTTGTIMLLPTQARAETSMAPKKSNFNYELGNGECQTSCVLKCESESLPKRTKSNNNSNNNSNCIDACVRSGQRYCHETTASKSSPSAKEATTSRYVSTTMEPTIKSSKPIPGLSYNSNRGGAWRD